MISSSMRLSLTGGQVGWMTNASRPRTFSVILTKVSPSVKRGTSTAEGDAEVVSDLLGERPIRIAGEQLEVVRHRPASPERHREVVGAEGFEPPNTGPKVPRLTA